MKQKIVFTISVLFLSLTIFSIQLRAEENPFKMVNNYVPTELDTISVIGQEGYILFPTKVENFRFGSNSFHGKAYGKILEVSTKSSSPTSLLVCCGENLNYLVIVDPMGGNSFTKLSRLRSVPDEKISELQAQQNFISNQKCKFNSKEADKKLQEVIVEDAIDNYGISHDGLELYLKNYKQDYQLQYFKLVVNNRTDTEFQFDIIETYYESQQTLNDLYPVARSYTNVAKSGEESAFGFALPNDFNLEFYVRLKDRKNNREIKLLIPVNILKDKK